MAVKSIQLGHDPAPAVREAAAVLLAGGVMIFPTETVYGIGVAAGDARALAKLRALKRRDADKPFQLLVSDVTMAKRLGAVFSMRAERLARNYWPGPMTMVVPDGTGSTLGIRIPNSPFVLALCGELDRAIISSSANPAGAPPPGDAADADVFGDAVALLVDGGPVIEGVPSTVVKCEGDTYVILRRGGISDDAIDAAWNE